MGNETIKLRGVVLKEIFVGESDKIITILAKEKGKLSISARGARKPKSKFMASCQIFAYCDFVAYHGKNFYALTQAEIIDSFYPLRENLDSLAYAAYFAELLDKLILEGAEHNDALFLLLKTLQAMEKEDCNFPLIRAAFQMKLLSYFGYQPQLTECVVCGAPKDAINAYGFSSVAGGLVCAHHPGAKKPLSASGLKALQYILDVPMGRLYQFFASPEVARELAELSKEFFYTQTELTLKTEGFLQSIESL